MIILRARITSETQWGFKGLTTRSTSARWGDPCRRSLSQLTLAIASLTVDRTLSVPCEEKCACVCVPLINDQAAGPWFWPLFGCRCLLQFSKYTCPRCNVQYCSLDCYKSEVGGCWSKTSLTLHRFHVHLYPIMSWFISMYSKQKHAQCSENFYRESFMSELQSQTTR